MQKLLVFLLAQRAIVARAVLYVRGTGIIQ